MTNRTCYIPGCTRTPPKHKSRCSTCAHRIRLYGDPTIARYPLDPVVIDAAVRDRRAPAGMRLRERRDAGLKLTDLGLPATEIARIFGVAPRTVTRWRAARRADMQQAA